MTSYFLCYDIAEDALREKLAKLLLQKGCRRAQKSVFFAPNYSAKELAALKQAVHRLLAGRLGPEESVLCVPVTKSRLASLLIEGESPGLQRSLTDDLHLLV